MKQVQLSIAMTAYNGSRFIQQQLDSIADQTRLPDELVVCDDGSTDDTVAIIQRFASTSPFPVRLFVNLQNLGFSKNFEKAINLCKGDVIFISDQDDVWHSKKLERCAALFVESPELGMVFTDSSLVNEELQPLGYTLWERFGFDLEQQSYYEENRGFEIQIRHSFAVGAAIAFRASLKSFVLPIPDIWLYDAWIPTVIAEIAPCRLIPEPLYKYRQHEKQAMGARKKNILVKYIEAKRQENPQFILSIAEQYIFLRKYLLALDTVHIDSKIIAMLDRKIAFYRKRAQIRSLFNLLRLKLVFQEALTQNYTQFALGWKTILRDIFI